MTSADMFEPCSLSDRCGISSKQGPYNADLNVSCMHVVLTCLGILYIWHATTGVVCYLCSLCRCEELETVETYLSNHITSSSAAKRFQHSWRQLGGKQLRDGIRQISYVRMKASIMYLCIPLLQLARTVWGLEFKDRVFLCPRFADHIRWVFALRDAHLKAWDNTGCENRFWQLQQSQNMAPSKRSMLATSFKCFNSSTLTE